MKKTLRNFLWLVIVAALSGCALPNSQKVMNTWGGHNISEATAKLGPPSRIVRMPDGTTMYVWEGVYDDGEYLCSKGLVVDHKGTIVRASQRTESLACE